MAATVITPMLSAEQIDAIASAVAAKQLDLWLTKSPIISVSVAMAYCEIESERSWHRFCSENGLERVSAGRYERQAVERALARELKEARYRK